MLILHTRVTIEPDNIFNAIISNILKHQYLFSICCLPKVTGSYWWNVTLWSQYLGLIKVCLCCQVTCVRPHFKSMPSWAMQLMEDNMLFTPVSYQYFIIFTSLIAMESWTLSKWPVCGIKRKGIIKASENAHYYCNYCTVNSKLNTSGQK